MNERTVTAAEPTNPDPPSPKRGAAGWTMLLAVWALGLGVWTIYLAVIGYLVVLILR